MLSDWGFSSTFEGNENFLCWGKISWQVNRLSEVFQPSELFSRTGGLSGDWEFFCMRVISWLDLNLFFSSLDVYCYNSACFKLQILFYKCFYNFPGITCHVGCHARQSSKVSVDDSLPWLRGKVPVLWVKCFVEALRGTLWKTPLVKIYIVPEICNVTKAQ